MSCVQNIIWIFGIAGPGLEIVFRNSGSGYTSTSTRTLSGYWEGLIILKIKGKKEVGGLLQKVQ